MFRKRSSQFAVTTLLRGCAVNRAEWTMSFARRFVQAKKTGGPRYSCTQGERVECTVRDVAGILPRTISPSSLSGGSGGKGSFTGTVESVH